MICAALLMVAFFAAANDESEQQSGKSDKPPEFLTAVPESPAFTYLGTTPATVARPGSVRDLALQLISGVNAEGRVVSGFALETSLWQLIPGARMSLDRYQGNPWDYILANTQISAATVRTDSDPSATDLGVGVKLILLDRGDPMGSSEFTSELGEELKKCLPAQPAKDGKTSLACVDRVIADRFGRWTAKHWNAVQVSLAVAAGWQFADTDPESDQYSGVQAWLAASGPLGRKARILGQVAFLDQQEVVGKPASSRWSLGARAVFGRPEFNGFVEVIGESVSSAETNEDRVLWSVGADVRIARDLWVTVGVGKRFEALDTDGRTAVLANFRWGMLSSSRIAKLEGLAPK